MLSKRFSIGEKIDLGMKTDKTRPGTSLLRWGYTKLPPPSWEKQPTDDSDSQPAE